MILAIFDLQVTQILSIKFQVIRPFCSGEEVQNTFSRRQLWWPSFLSDQNNVSYYGSISHPDAFYQVLSQLSFQLRRRSAKQISQIAAMAAILDFSLE